MNTIKTTMIPDININRLLQHCDAQIAHARQRIQLFGNDLASSGIPLRTLERGADKAVFAVVAQHVMSIVKFECECDGATAETIWSRVITEIGTSFSPSSSAIQNEINRQLADTWRALFRDIVDGWFAGDDEVRE